MYIYIYIYIYSNDVSADFQKLKIYSKIFLRRILSIETSSIKFEKEPPFIKFGYPIILRAMLSTEGRSAGYIMWSHRVSKSFSE